MLVDTLCGSLEEDTELGAVEASFGVDGETGHVGI